MSNELWTSIIGLPASQEPFGVTQPFTQLLDMPLPLPVDFTRCVVGLRTTATSLNASTFFIAPNLSFDYYEIRCPDNMHSHHEAIDPAVTQTGFLCLTSDSQI